MAFFDLGIKGKFFKGFGEEPQGLDKIYPINIIIGRNNSGKSALLDLVQFTCGAFDIESLGHRGNKPEIIISKPIEEAECKKVFSPSHSGGDGFPNHINHLQFISQYIGQRISFSLNGHERRFYDVEFEVSGQALQKVKLLLNNFHIPIQGMVFRKLSAERDIRPEAGVVANGQLHLDSQGNGATNIIQAYLTRSNLDSMLIEQELLNHLNKILNPDSNFTGIIVKQLPVGNWEIYLEEKDKGRIPLSSSGSGLKTIILVLMNLIVMPKIHGQSLNQLIFGFEELENNLHPALQRRLVSYLKNFAKEGNCSLFLTTHSNVIIDLFNKDEDVQMLHVSHNGKEATVRSIKTYLEKKGILDDLDIRASDLLQSNCVIWVEGPSDRLYFNRWIGLISNGTIQEGFHYQCVFYGGRLLAHLNAEEDNKETVSVLKVNCNAVIIMDSDQKNSEEDINDTKKRIQTEFHAMNAISWITEGKEVENYLDQNVFMGYYELPKVRNLGKYELISDYLNKIKKEEGDRFLKNKVLYAEYFLPFITKDLINSNKNLKDNLIRIYNYIAKCNSIDIPPL
jgi:hypothetical protein